MATLGEYLPNANTKLSLHLNGSSVDSSGLGNNGTDTNITYVDGKFGKCASFNGSSSGILINSLILPSTPTSFSICGWIKTSYKASQQCIISDRIPTGNVYYKYAVSIDTGGKINFWQDKSLSAALCNGTSDVTDNKYHFFSCIFDNTNSTLKVFVDGNLETTISGNQYPSLSNISTIGYLNASGGIWRFNGLIDEVIVENRAWSASEVKKYYTYSRGFYSTI